MLVCPNWPKSPWWEKIHSLTAKAHFYPAGTRLFETDEGIVGPTRWGVWILYIPSPEQKETQTHTVQTVRGERSLHILATIKRNGEELGPPVTALIDRGASVTLIRKGLFPDEYFQPAQHPTRLTAANGKRVVGGDREIRVQLRIKGFDLSTKKLVELVIPTTFIEAELPREEVILGYNWFRDREFNIFPRQHRILCKRRGQEIWVEGLRLNTASDPQPVAPVVNDDESPPPKALDLFAGTGSASSV